MSKEKHSFYIEKGVNLTKLTAFFAEVSIGFFLKFSFKLHVHLNNTDKHVLKIRAEINIS